MGSAINQDTRMTAHETTPSDAAYGVAFKQVSLSEYSVMHGVEVVAVSDVVNRAREIEQGRGAPPELPEPMFGRFDEDGVPCPGVAYTAEQRRPTAKPAAAWGIAMSELRECPCGRPAVISAADIAGRRSAHCDDQDCYWSIVGFSDEQVTERWNRRHDPAPVGVRVPDATHLLHTATEAVSYTGFMAHDDEPCVALRSAVEDYEQQMRAAETANPQPGAVVGDLASELRELVGDYWNLAYAEGSEGRNQDTENHDAQRTILRIEEIIRTLTNTDKGSAG